MDTLDTINTVPPLTIEEKAALFARTAHESIGQLRRYSGQPYFEHSARVADIVRSAGLAAHVVAAAYLHDVVEDVPLEQFRELVMCNYPNVICELSWSETDESARANKLKMLAAVFGEDVSRLVEQVTNLSKPADGTRAFRKQLELEHLSRACSDAQTIKYADLIDNSSDIEQLDPVFARTYLSDKAELLKIIEKGDATLLIRALGSGNFC